MLHEEIEGRAAARELKKERLLFRQLDSSLLSQCSYLFRRLRYPVLQRVMVKILILVEAYLLYRFFYLNLALSVIFIFYLLNFLRQLSAPITQRLREVLTTYRLEDKMERASETLQAALACILGLSVIGGVTIGIWATTSIENPFLLALIFTHIVIFPISMASQTAWSAVYTEQRLRRRFLPVLGSLFLPSVCLVMFSEPFGPYAYVAGVFIGELCESIYLLSLAITKLHEQRMKIFRVRGLLPSIKRLILSWDFLHSGLALIGAPLYAVLIAIALFTYRPELWLGYFLISHLTNLLAYPINRISHAYGVDIFMSLKQQDFFHAARLIGRCRRYTFLLTVIIASLITVGIVTFVTEIQFSLQEQYVYWIFLVLLLAAKSTYTQHMNLTLWMGSERTVVGGIIALGFVLFIPLQMIFLLILRANLAFILLNETIFFFLMAILLTAYQSVRRSPYGQSSISPESCIISNPLSLESYNKDYKKIAIVQTERNFSATNDIHRLFRKISLELKQSFRIIPISRNTYLFLLPHEDAQNAEDFLTNLEHSFASCLRGTYRIAHNQISLLDLREMVESFSRYRHCDSWIKTMLHCIRSGTWDEVSTYLKENGKISLHEIRQLLSENHTEESAFIWYERKDLESRSIVALDALKKMTRSQYGSHHLPQLLSRKGDVLTIKILFMPLLALSKDGIPREKIAKITEIMTTLEIYLNLIQDGKLRKMA